MARQAFEIFVSVSTGAIQVRGGAIDDMPGLLAEWREVRNKGDVRAPRHRDSAGCDDRRVDGGVCEVTPLLSAMEHNPRAVPVVRISPPPTQPMTLEMPFKDNPVAPESAQGWSPERSKLLARDCLAALLEWLEA